MPTRVRSAGVALLVCVLVLLGAGVARSASAPQVTISLITQATNEPGFNVLIANFERVYPNITVNPTYTASSAILYQLESTELAAGDAPDILQTTAGCGAPNAVCDLADAGDLAPMVRAPWAKRAPTLLTSYNKHGSTLFAFTPNVSPFGIFTNNALFAKLGLKVPTTFSQLLNVCKQASAAGSVPVLFDGGSGVVWTNLIFAFAANDVYKQDRLWNSQLKSGTVSFEGTNGWHVALQQVNDMRQSGCFSPGAPGTASGSGEAAFAQGQGLMLAASSGQKGTVDAASPGFGYSFYNFPAGNSASTTDSMFAVLNSFSVNAHSSAANQAAAQTFINFLARPKEDALYASLKGGLTPDQAVKDQPPTFMAQLTSVFGKGNYVVEPSLAWWNASVQNVLEQQAVGLLTGQSTSDTILTAMDAAWKQGPT